MFNFSPSRKSCETITISDECRDSRVAIERISKVQEKVLKCDEKKIIIKVTSPYIAPALYPIVWSMPYLDFFNNAEINMQHSKNNERLHRGVKMYGVESHYKKTSYDVNNKSCISGFSLNKTIDDWLPIIYDIMGSLPVKLSDSFEEKFLSKISELFANAHTHGENGVGSFSTVYYDRNNRKLVFSLYDLGIGIPKNVNNYITQQSQSSRELSLQDAFEWALQDGNSTLEAEYPRGLGFGVLERFIKENNGKIHLCSDNGFYKINKKGRQFYVMPHSLKGTFFSILKPC